MAQIEFTCINCGKQHSSNNNSSTLTYCSNKCQGEYVRKKNIADWVSGHHSPGPQQLRKYLLELRGHRCEKCKLSEWLDLPITLEVEHIDGNSSNNIPENVILLCPNCHSQTSTYKSKNKGHGRHTRRTRYKEGLSF